jgi:TM2 domain-containing membrane protein YozV
MRFPGAWKQPSSSAEHKSLLLFMRKLILFFLCCVFSITTSVKGKSVDISTYVSIKGSTAVLSEIKNPVVRFQFAVSDSLQINMQDTMRHQKHRFVAALLAFPLGIFGLHRMYLGSSKAVPLVYIVTLGGAFGILPFIDFVMIILSKDKDFHATYTGNHHLFMWQKK